MAEQKAQYRIAGLTLEIILPEAPHPDELLPNFRPFISVDHPMDKAVCVIKVSSGTAAPDESTGKLLSDVSVVWGERFGFYELEASYLTRIGTADEEAAFVMESAKDFSHATIHMPEGASQVQSVLSWLIMVAFGQACLLYRTILMHASVVEYQGKGFAFLGKSGTGKSTHSRLWLQQFPDAALLNDDNPAVRVAADGQVYVYGTPWSGKTDCYRNKHVPLHAFVRLRQAAYNKFSLKTGMEALVCVLPSCTAIRWNKQLFARMTDTVESLLQELRVAELDCLPNLEAAENCYQEIYKN